MIDPPAEQPMLSTPTARAGGRFRFVVHGIPVQQGSKNCRCLPNGKPSLYDVDAHRLGAWRKLVTTVARNEYRTAGYVVALDGPLQVSATFRFNMPASRSAGDKTTGLVWKRTAPDLDKLMRALGDSLTDAGVIHDDARICRLNICKQEIHLGWTGVDVIVEQLWNAP